MKRYLMIVAVFVVAYIGFDTFIQPMANDRNASATRYDEAAQTINNRATLANRVRSNADNIELEIETNRAKIPETALQQEVLREITERWAPIGITWESVSSDAPSTGPFAPLGRATEVVHVADDSGPAAANEVETDDEKAARLADEELAARQSVRTTYPLSLRIKSPDAFQLSAALNELRAMDRTLVVDNVQVRYGSELELSITARYFAFEVGSPEPIPQF